MTRNRSDVEEAPTRRVAGAAMMQPTVTESLTRAFFEEWARVGFGALSLESVARRAGVGKAALYRRWPSKVAMASDRLGQLGEELAATPDTGSLEGDVLALLKSVRRLLRHPLVRRILPDLHAEMVRNLELALAVRERVQAGRRERGTAVFERAIARGELHSGVDVELANDAVAGLIYWRLIVTGGRADAKYLRQTARFIVAALRADV